MPSCVAGMSIFTTTDLPSKKSFRAASLWAPAGTAAPPNTHTDSSTRWTVSMREKIPRQAGLHPDLNQRFVEAGAFAVGALPRLGDLVGAEREAAAPAARGLDPDLLVR